jgi:hypothetical protein
LFIESTISSSTLFVMDSKKTETRLIELERRINVAMRGLNFFLFKDAEEISSKERKILEQELSDYTRRKRKSNFVELKKYFQGQPKTTHRELDCQSN